MSKFFDAESAVNYEQKSLCVLLLDISYSMDGKRLESLQMELNHFWKYLGSNFKKQIKVAILTYGNNVEVLQQPALVRFWNANIKT